MTPAMRPIASQSVAPHSDEELIAGILAGDAACLELLMRRHNQRLFRVARAIIRNDAEAEDIVQETYVRAYANLHRFEGRASVATWLSRIALHESLRRRRRQRRLLELEHEMTTRAPQPDAGQPTGRIEQAERRAALVVALDSLPATLRAVVMLRLVEGLSTSEAAACLRLTESNVKVALHRARGRLAKALEESAIDELRAEFSFAQERCDRIVAGVFRRLGVN